MAQAHELAVERSSDAEGEGVDEVQGNLDIEEHPAVDEIAGFVVWDGRGLWIGGFLVHLSFRLFVCVGLRVYGGEGRVEFVD